MKFSARWKLLLAAAAAALLLTGCVSIADADVRSESESCASSSQTGGEEAEVLQQAPAAPKTLSAKVVPMSDTYKTAAEGGKARLSARQELRLYTKKSAAVRAEPAKQPTALQTAAAASGDEVPDDLVLLDTFVATAYCQTGTTATGTYTTVGRSLSVNPGVIPYGTHVWIYLDDGTYVGDYYAEDTGSNMQAHPYVVDIYMGTSRQTCIDWGARHVSIYVEP
jgi:3D (Asp-Asp-Asp) domain-containing protein